MSTQGSGAGLGAYLGDGQLKQHWLTMLQAHHLANRLRPGVLAWDGSTGSVVGTLLRSDSLAHWTARSGMPSWLAVLLDGLPSSTQADDTLPQPAGQLLVAITPGAQLDPVGSRFIRLLLCGPDLGVAGLAAPWPELQRLLLDIAEQHACSDQGTDSASPSTSHWADLQQRALQITNGREERYQTLELALAQLAEGAAWDPVTSRSAVLDTLRLWAGVRRVQASQQLGWTLADHLLVQSTLSDLHRQHVAPAPADAPNVFTLLEQHHPQLAQRMKAMLRAEDQQGGLDAPLVVQALQRLLAPAEPA